MLVPIAITVYEKPKQTMFINVFISLNEILSIQKTN